MKLIFNSVVVLLTLTGCSGSGLKMSSWLGVSEQQLVNQLGVPHEIDEQQAQKNLVWFRYIEATPTCEDRFTIRNDRVTTYFSDCGIWGGFNGPVYQSIR